VQVPQIDSVKQIEEIVQNAKFAPLGKRGVCRFVRAAEYSTKDRNEYFKQANEALIIVQLEGKEAVLNLDDIIEKGAVDIFFVGPYDLSQSLGVPGQIKHPDVVAVIEKIARKGRESGKIIGTFVDTVEDGLFWMDKGVSYIAYSVDVGIFAEGCKELVRKLTNSNGEKVSG
jgi:4-hydroxy-2-oxoheptanedioate aldolase